MKRYICPNCGQRCLSRQNGMQVQNSRSFYTVKPDRCPECNSYIQQRTAAKPRTLVDKLLYGAISLIALALLVMLIFALLAEILQLDGRDHLAKSLIWVPLAMIGMLAAIGLVMRFRYPKRTFVPVDENYNSLPLEKDLRVALDVSEIKHPHRVLFDYTAYDFYLEGQKVSSAYAVLLFPVYLKEELLYYELYFPGVHAGVALPQLEAGETFTLTDGRHRFSGSIIAIYEAYEKKRKLPRTGTRYKRSTLFEQ